MRRLLAPLLLTLGLIVATAAPAAASTQIEFSPVPIRATCQRLSGWPGPRFKITWYATQSVSTAATAELQVWYNGVFQYSLDVWVPLDTDGGYANRYYGPPAYLTGNGWYVRGIAYLNIQTVVGSFIFPTAIDGC